MIYDARLTAIALTAFISGCFLYFRYLHPILINKFAIIIDKNPKWITTKAYDTYYGLHDVDFLIVSENSIGHFPRVRIAKKEKRIEFLISENTSVNDVDALIHYALTCKLKIKYNMWYPHKPTFWLSILLYMLDGGDIQEKAISWEEKRQETI